ncbi:hypothetical protein ACH5RR_008877 [Cinchona calisaya]|uniref:Uncharacterized protein n=1 Tax=Cinchona calisaya TaxID=153742 RepID=A0ABD3AG72_9GENT
MPGVVMDENHEEEEGSQANENGNLISGKENLAANKSLNGDLTTQNPPNEEGEESRIDSELRHLVGGEMREVEIMEEDEVVRELDNDDSHSDLCFKKESSQVGNLENSQSGSTKATSFQSKKATQSQLDSDAPAISSPKGKVSQRKPPKDERE